MRDPDIIQALELNPIAMLGSFLARRRPPASACAVGMSLHHIARLGPPVPYGVKHPSGS